MIKGLSEKRRLPRAGKIKLGVMVTPANGKPYPRATDYFVSPDIVQEVFGAKPKELRIMFPLDDEEKLFPQELKMYKSGGGLFCAGNGEIARRWSDQGELVERTCPCEYLENGQCKPTAVLNFLLPEVKQLGVWQLVCHGKTAIISLNSCLDHYVATFGGLRGIPFLLRLEQQETQRYDKVKGMVRQTIFVPTINAPVSYSDVLNYRKAIGGKVEVMMLPSAPLVETDERDESEAETIEAVQASPVMGPAAERTPAAGTGTPASQMGWTIESCYLAAKGIGLEPKLYEDYLTAVYKSPDLNGAAIAEQAKMFEQAEAGGKQARDLLVKSMKLKGLRPLTQRREPW